MLITQSQWPLHSSMPSRKLETSAVSPFGAGLGSFKRHKVLPHPPHTSDDSLSELNHTSTSSATHSLSIDTAFSTTSPSSQASSPRTLKHTTRRRRLPDLPPTPPSHSRQSSAGSDAIAVQPVLAPNPRVTTPVEMAAPSTPPNQRSPPTPDVTPPRAGSQQSFALRPPPTDRYPSSRADSFKTAPEFPESDDDEVSTVRLNLSSSKASEATLKMARPIGLGLGLESENGHSPSPRISKDPAVEARNSFVTFDGEWGSSQGEVSEVEKEWDDNLMRNVTVRRRPNNRNRVSHIYDNTPLRQEIIDDNPVTPTNATKLLQDLKLDTNALWSAPIKPSPSINSPSAQWTRMASPGFPSTPDLRRLSAMSSRSGHSTIIEAMVVDVTPQGKKTLRHTKKYAGLRDFSSSTSTQSSRAESMSSVEPTHRLVHTIKNRDLRHYSLGSGTTSTTSSSGISRRDVLKSGAIPVVVVPERKSSSMKSGKTPSLRSTSSWRTAHKRSNSLNSAPQSSSSRSREHGYFDLPTKRVRRMSETASSHSQRTIDFPPVIPARSSSLSAPTSRNGSKAGSRTGSLTAESLKAHNLVLAANAKSALTGQDVRSAASLNVPETPRHRDDPRKLSAQATPFSAHSYETAGTVAEVSEARTISLFPHQNKSLLMVQHPGSNTSPTDSAPPALPLPNESRIPSNETVLHAPQTPSQPSDPFLHNDSPFRNPREPPLPPAIKFIPPTPGVLTPSTEINRQLGNLPEPPVSDIKPKRGFSLRRALTSRRHSESIITRTFSLKRPTNSASTQTSKANANLTPLYPTVDDQPIEASRLHPFWRPARFWDDLEDGDYSDDEYYANDEDYGDGIRDAAYPIDAYPRIDNRPQLPKRSLSGRLARTFAILPIKDDPYYAPEWTERRVVRRTGSGNLKVVRNRNSLETLRRARLVWDEYDRGRREGRPRGQGMGVTEAWKGLSRRLSERRREKRQGKLRGMISGPTEVVDDRTRVLGGDRHNTRQIEFYGDSNGHGGVHPFTDDRRDHEFYSAQRRDDREQEQFQGNSPKF